VHLGVENNFISQQKAHPALGAANVETMAQTLITAGYPVTWDRELPGRRRFYTTDPFGNRIEIIQHGDGFGQK
jgi:hypothetical protein